MAFDNQSGDGAISQINVTPLVDVMLVLLVIFMVTAPILQQGVSVSLPQVEAAPLTGDGEELLVTVAGDGRVFLNEDEMDTTALAEKLGGLVAGKPEQQVFLRADQTVPYGEVMRVIASLRSAGVARLGMVTEPPAETEG
jgi:biopolymer transport protein TolR